MDKNVKLSNSEANAIQPNGWMGFSRIDRENIKEASVL